MNAIYRERARAGRERPLSFVIVRKVVLNNDSMSWGCKRKPVKHVGFAWLTHRTCGRFTPGPKMSFGLQENHFSLFNKVEPTKTDLI